MNVLCVASRSVAAFAFHARSALGAAARSDPGPAEGVAAGEITTYQHVVAVRER